MKRCPTCNQIVESRRDEIHRHVFVWTGTSILAWSAMLHAAHWTVAWWAERWQLVILFAGPTVVALYFLVRLVQERKRGAS